MTLVCWAVDMTFDLWPPLVQVVVGDIVRIENKRFFPADLLLLSSRYYLYL